MSNATVHSKVSHWVPELESSMFNFWLHHLLTRRTCTELIDSEALVNLSMDWP